MLATSGISSDVRQRRLGERAGIRFAVAVLAIGSAANLTANFGFHVVAARVLSATEYGDLASWWAVINIVTPLTSLGLLRAWVQRLAVAPDDVRREEYATGAVLLVIGSCLAASAYLGILGLGGQVRVGWFLVPWVVFIPLALARSAIEQLAERPSAQAGWSAVASVLKVCTIGCLAIVGSRNLTVIAGVMGVVSATGVVLAIRGLQVPTIIAFGRHVGRVPDLWRDSWPHAIAGFAYLVFYQADIYLLRTLDSAAAAAVYAPAAMIVGTSIVPATILFHRALLVRFHALHGARGYEELRRTFFRAIVITIAGGLCVAALFAVAGKGIATVLLGNEYGGTGYVLMALAPVPLLRCCSIGFETLLVTRRGSKYRALVFSVLGTANVIANVALVPRFGVWGAVWTTVACEVLLLGCFVYAGVRLLRNPEYFGLR
jgi:O-antigen/teichoic acid export membrane protein